MRRLACAALLLIACPVLAQDGTPGVQRLGFLLGTWTATGSGQPGTGTGSATFSRDVQGHVITRRSFAEYPASARGPASRHDDLMIIYEQDNSLRADFYDSEGHVIRYSIVTPADGEAVFVSDRTAGEPRYRLTYKLVGAVLKGQFEIAPNASESFKTYLEWDSTRSADR